MSEVTTKSIIEWISEKVEEKKADFDTSFWINVSLKLSILIGDEHGKLVDFRQALARKKLEIKDSQEKMSVAEAELRTEATQEYADYQKQKMFVEQIEEIIRVSKLLARITNAM